MIYQACITCKEEYSADEIIYSCKRCGDLLEVRYNFDLLEKKLEKSNWQNQPLSVWRYKDLMPIRNISNIVTLNEGGTGLHSCQRLAKHIGLNHLYIKNEGENPTGSFKDRGMTVGVTNAIEINVKNVICASTGNTSASLAAYAARAGLKCTVLIPSGKIAYGKLAQAMIYGANVVQIRGNFDQALQIVLELSKQRDDIYLLNSINPYRLEGQKSLAYEICDQLQRKPPNRVILPVGNAGNISAIWKGLTEYYRLNLITNLPKMVGIQAEGAAPIVQAIKNKKNKIIPINQPETVATAIRIGAPISWKKAMMAIKESNGGAETVTDKEILNAQKILARSEGIFVEPASASSIAGLKKLVDNGEIDQDEVVVCVTTGHGLKDPNIAVQISNKPHEVEAEVKSIENLLRSQSSISSK